MSTEAMLLATVLVWLGLFVGFIGAFIVFLAGMAMTGKWTRHEYKTVTCEPREVMGHVSEWARLGFRVVNVYESEAAGQRAKIFFEKRVFAPLAPLAW